MRRWDLDHVGKTREWQLLLTARPGSDQFFDPLSRYSSGTIVLWENLDRIVEHCDADDEKARRRFYELRARVEEHLGVVFHRYIANRTLNIYSNDNEVVAWDPFLEKHSSTQWLPLEELPLRNSIVSVQSYVLPHHSRLTEEQHRMAAGPNGWNASQGFYIYRADRMISHGGWLSRQIKVEEHCKLARIAVDITQDMDAAWDIDVRKARARPPGVLRDELTRIARATRARAAKVYRHRGKTIRAPGTGEPVPVWCRRKIGKRIEYRIDRTHPGIRSMLEDSPSLRGLIKLIERTIPVPRIAIDAYENPDAQNTDATDNFDPDLQRVAELLIHQSLQNGQPARVVRQQLMNMEPFDQFPEAIDDLLERSA